MVKLYYGEDVYMKINILKKPLLASVVLVVLAFFSCVGPYNFNDIDSSDQPPPPVKFAF
jgi:hypothetical protein